MNSNAPLLTVILVTYNHEDCIARALDSVLEQETTYAYVIWLCDDCSTDNTLSICKDYAKKHPDKIKLIAQPENTYSNPGKIFHGFAAIKNVQSRYFSYLEGDDAWCDKHKIQVALDVLENNPQYVTFAHDTTYNFVKDGVQKSLVHDIHKIDVQNPVVFETAPYLHTSARIHRNVVSFPDDLKMLWDIAVFYTYLDKGPLYYHDQIMSVYNFTGKGLWTSLSSETAKKTADMTYARLNKSLNYKYDAFFSNKMGKLKVLELLKNILGIKLAWECWFLWLKVINWVHPVYVK